MEAGMQEFNETVTINRPADAVFDYVADITRWPEWRLSLTSAECAAQGPLGFGSTIHASGQVMGRTMDMALDVSAFEPGERIGFTTSSGPVSIEAEFRFAPDGAGTRVTVAGTVEPS